MVTRQRRSKAKPIEKKDRLSGPSQSRSSRLSLLLAVLALTTALLIALQVSRFQSGKGNVAINQLLSTIGKSTGRGQISRSLGGLSIPEADVDAMKKRLGAIGKQFQDEIAKVKSTIQSSQSGSRGEAAAGMSIVPGESVEGHSIDPVLLLQRAPHVAEKSDEEAAEDQKIGLQDLDQDTLKAMFDALNSRD